MIKIIKRSPFGKSDKGWWIHDGFAFWGKQAIPGYGYGPRIGFDTKQDALDFAKSEGLIQE
jgi:hypothetical protein